MKDGLRINGEQFGKMFVSKPELEAGGVAFYDGTAVTPADVEARMFYEALANGTDILVKPEQALVVTEILEAIYVSGKTGKPVYFDGQV